MSDIPRISDLLPSKAPTAQSMLNYIRCLATTRSGRPSLLAAAAEAYPSDIKLQNVVKAAIQAGSLSGMSTLAPYRVVASEFVEASRASSIVGRLTQARRVPLRIKVARSPGGSVATWIAEGAPKTVSTLSLDEITLDPKKSSVIVVTTEEVARFSSPSSDALLRSDLTRAVNAAIDAALISTSAATSSTPGGVLAGTSPVTSTGSGAQAISKDIGTVIAAMLAAGGQGEALTILAHPSTMTQIALTLGANGATLGIPVLTSSTVPAGKLIVIDQSELLLGTDDGIEFSLSNEADVMMDSAPVDGTTKYTNLWQHNLVGIRAEQFINWIARRSNAALAGSVVSIAL